MNNLVDKRTVLVTLRHALLEWSDMPKWRDDQIIKAIKEIPFAQSSFPQAHENDNAIDVNNGKEKNEI